MEELRIPVSVIVERRPASGPWIDHVWMPVAVLPAPTVAQPWTVLHRHDGVTAYIAGQAEVELNSSDTLGYKANLDTGRPMLWVVLRSCPEEPGMELHRVVVDATEAEALVTTVGSGDVIEPVPMPGPVREAIEAFVAEHHRDRGFFKRQRDRADPEALAVRPRAGGGDHGRG
jgi:hypothetical protein